MTSAAVARLLNTTSRPGPPMKISSPPLPFRMSGPLPPAMQASSRDVPSRTVGPFSPVLASHASSAKAAPPGQAKRNKARTAVSANPITAVATKRSRSHTILSMTPPSAACCSPEHRSSLPYPGDGSHRPKVVGRSEVLTGSPRARISQPGEWLRRPLVVGDSAEVVCDLDEIGLVTHHHVERLVGRGMLVQQLARLVTLPRRLSHRWPEVLDRERPARLTPGHRASGPVRARLIRLGVAEPAHDVRALAHGARDQAPVAHSRTDRPLAGDPQHLPTVPLQLGVVVVAVHLERRGHVTLQDLAESRVGRLEHELPVAARVPLGPPQVAQVGLELGRPLLEPRELRVRQREGAHAARD